MLPDKMKLHLMLGGRTATTLRADEAAIFSSGSHFHHQSCLGSAGAAAPRGASTEAAAFSSWASWKENFKLCTVSILSIREVADVTPKFNTLENLNFFLTFIHTFI
jgi:hypothetical protein